MSLSRACLLLMMLWAVVYLPGLGSQEIRGEEWRRVLPGRTMLNTGEWVVPQIGARPYLRKPPLINWISAGSFALFGTQNEWTARLPSALTVLITGIGMTVLMSRVIGVGAAWLAGVMFLGMAGVLEKGRMAELEVYYIAFTGLALVAWLTGFMRKMNKGLAWLLAGGLLGLGMLIKGPVHLLFFYGMIIGACWKTGRWKELFSFWHGLAILVYVGIFAAWAVPLMQAYGQMVGVEPAEVLDYWKEQLASRTEGDERTTVADWLLRGPEALALFLPWILLLPWFWRKNAREVRGLEGENGKVFDGLMWGAVGGFVVMILIPSSSPRYVMPLCAPVAVLTAWWLAGWWSIESGKDRMKGIWSKVLTGLLMVLGLGLMITGVLLWNGVHRNLGVMAMALGMVLPLMYWVVIKVKRPKSWLSALSGWTVVAMGMGAMLVTSVDVRRPESLRALGQEIQQAIQPQDGPLYVFRLGPLPYLFYLPVDSVEERVRKELPPSGVRWMLTTDEALEKFGRRLQRDYGAVEWRREFFGTWGESEMGNKMVLVRFAGHHHDVGKVVQ